MVDPQIFIYTSSYNPFFLRMLDKLSKGEDYDSVCNFLIDNHVGWDMQNVEAFVSGYTVKFKVYSNPVSYAVSSTQLDTLTSFIYYLNEQLQ